MFIIKLIYAILFILSGIGIIKYRKVIKSWTGTFYWAEKYIGSGGTYFVILLCGAGLIFFGVTYLFGGSEQLLEK